MPPVASTCPLAARARRFAFVIVALLASAPSVPAQSTAVLRGIVRDAQGGVIAAAEICLSTASAAVHRDTVTEPDGSFQLADVPPGTYELRVEYPHFAAQVRRLDLRADVPPYLDVVLQPKALATSTTVAANPAAGDAASGGTRHRISASETERMPAPVGSRGLESVLVAFPGFAQNANGAIHPRGAHNQMTYVIDGLPISDQLTGSFANALDAGIVQEVELMTGNIPAEYGSKVSGVALVSTQSGLGTGRRLAGDLALAAAGFNTWQGTLQAGGGGQRRGYFGSVTAMRTDRFLDQVSLDNLHNAGAFTRGFGRADFTLADSGLLRINAMGGRSAFDIANLRSQHAAGQDQRQRLGDAAGWASYMRALDSGSTFESTLGFRTSSAVLLGSDGDTPVTASQRRRLSTLTASARYARVVGSHHVRAGADLQYFPVREHFTLGITSPGFNEPGSERFNPALLRHDLSRGGTPFVFDEAEAGRLGSAFVQGTFRLRAATLNAGLRYDAYRFLASGQQLQPRVGVAWQLPRGVGVLRLSYNRNYQTPPHENLLLSSSPAAGALAPESVKRALGGSYRPVQPERQHVYEAGFQRAFGGAASVDVSVYRKDSRDQQDNNNFFDTGIIFPTTLAAIRVTGAEARVRVTGPRGVSGTLSATTSRAVSTPPFTGGLFLGQDAVDLLSSGPFAIDHDQELALHASLQYDPPGPAWVASSIRYDSGLVANPSDPAKVAADPDFADLLPYVDLNAGVPRVRPRTIVDVAGGIDLKSSAGSRTWSVQLQVTNLTNRTALYNFQSVFVGTRLVQPRTVAVRVKRHF